MPDYRVVIKPSAAKEFDKLPVSVAERVAAKIEEKGGRSLFVQTDVGDAASVRNLVARVEEIAGLMG